MAFDKTKVVRAAEKYIAQGKFPAAIKEYTQIVANDPNDFTTLNMLGDLYGRTGKSQEAIDCFIRIAEHYREQGFESKAIAMYKKIERLAPGTLDVAKNLAVLFESQGLNVEARAHYLVVAEAYTRAGQSEEALEVLRKVADLDPQNTEIRLKLAEGYMQQGFQTEAARAYTEAGAQFLARGSFERSLEAYNQALELHPYDQEALHGLVNAHGARGTADEAAEVLETMLAARPDDAAVRELLVRAYIEAEDAPSAERVTVALVEEDPSSYSRFEDVIRLYLKAGDAHAAGALLPRIVEPMLTGRDEERLLELANEILERDPEQVEALRALARVYWWQRETEKLRVALERLVEAAEAAHLVEEERSALAQLVRLVPDQSKYLERLHELGGAPVDEPEEAVRGEITGEADVPTFESFTMLNDDALEATPLEVEPAEASSAMDEDVEAAPKVSSDAFSFADLNEDWTGAEDASSDSAGFENTGSVQTPANDFQEFDLGFGSNEQASTTPATAKAATPAEPLDARREAMLRQELDSVDFYLAQGYTDIAADTLEMLERQFGTHAEIDERREKLQTTTLLSDASAPHPTATESVEFSDFSLYDVAEEASPATSHNESENDFTLAFDDPPTPPQQPITVTASPASNASHASVPAQQVAAINQPLVHPELAALFDEFRTAAEEDEPASNGDYETHYNLGLAYKEMDLMEEAVEEFQFAIGLAAPSDGTARYLQCCNLLGHCFMQKGMPRLAVTWFKKGLDAPGHTGDEYLALRYELGLAYEQLGDLDSAIDTFTEVYGVNISYRGVGAKLNELQTEKAK
jgi:tetratricopeptide (TPR) repeat protein